MWGLFYADVLRPPTIDQLRDEAWRRAKGAEWVEASGAAVLRQCSTSFEQYAADTDSDRQLFHESLSTIDKDVPRTRAQSFANADLRGLVVAYELAVGRDELQRQLRRIATAVVRRTQRGDHHGRRGYTQGQTHVVAALLLFCGEADAFWLLVSLIEKLAPPDLYSEPPAALNGALAEAHVVEALLCLSPRNVTDAEVELTAQVMTIKMAIPLLVDCVALPLMVAVWDTVFLGRGFDYVSYTIAATISVAADARNRRQTARRRGAPGDDERPSFALADETMPLVAIVVKLMQRGSVRRWQTLAGLEGSETDPIYGPYTVLHGPLNDLDGPRGPGDGPTRMLSGPFVRRRLGCRQQGGAGLVASARDVERLARLAPPKRVAALRLAARRALAAAWERPSRVRDLEEQSAFSAAEVEALQAEFSGRQRSRAATDTTRRRTGDGDGECDARLSLPSRPKVLGRAQLLQLLRAAGVPVSSDLAGTVLHCGSDEDGAFAFRDVVCALSSACAGTVGDRLALLFAVYDVDGSGFLERSEIDALVLILAEASTAPASDLEAMLLSLDGDGDGKVSREEWLQAARSPGLLEALGFDVCGFDHPADESSRAMRRSLALRALRAVPRPSDASSSRPRPWFDTFQCCWAPPDGVPPGPPRPPPVRDADATAA
ncbi:hypothetical protein M885DRAFT_517904 [Pelagophyceae sp. CCMP2097]|nr:hypothetical protein M885DRAFT_517904 [Pelagophyceae sp. CCMP2097]